MFQSIIHRLLLRRHFWRHATFSEVAEIYMSRTLRLFALRMVAVFVSVFLLQNGFSVFQLTLFWAFFFGYKAVFSYPAALIVARIGPKHSTFVSNILSASSLFFLPLLPEYGLPMLFTWCVLQASSTCLYDLSYLVDFSKVKNAKHNGKEIAFMNILDKVASGLSPIIGGVLATMFGPEPVMVLAALLFLVAAWPLFRTGEPVPTHQKLYFRGFPWRSTWRSLLAQMGAGVDNYATGSVWVIFVSTVILAGTGNGVYAAIGVLSSVSLIAAIASSYAFGRLIDNRKGGDLLRISVWFNGAVHLVRGAVSTPLSVAMVNVANEAATTGYTMAFTRGLFDLADTSGRRVVYLYLVEVVANLGNMLAALLLALCIALIGDPESGMKLFFVFAAVISLSIMTARFPLYRR